MIFCAILSANVHTCPLYYTRTQSHRLLSGRDKNPNKTKIQIKLQRCRFSEIHDLKTFSFFSFLLQCVIVVFLCLSCLALCQGPWLVDWLIDWHRYQCCWSDRLPSSRSGLYVRVDLIGADDEQRGRSFPLWNRGQNVYQPPLTAHFYMATLLGTHLQTWRRKSGEWTGFDCGMARGARRPGVRI